MSWQDVRGDYQEQDDPSPFLCSLCGAVLPDAPDRVETYQRLMWSDEKVIDPKLGAEGGTYWSDIYEDAQEPIWVCPSCGSESGLDPPF